jgi:nitroreductase
MEKPAPTAHPIHELLARRWSPLAFDERPVEGEKLQRLLEAARWSPSSFNEQPWAFFVGTREDAEAHERLERCLVPGNRAWAARAPVLILSAAKQDFDHSGRSNRHAAHDVGLATMSLIVQAVAEGLMAHAMAGFDAELARRELSIPAGWEPMAMIAVGYPGDPALLDDAQRRREMGPRKRKEISTFVFGSTWGEAPRGLF